MGPAVTASWSRRRPVTNERSSEVHWLGSSIPPRSRPRRSIMICARACTCLERLVRGEPSRHPAGQRAVALDQVDEPGAAQRAEGGAGPRSRGRAATIPAPSCRGRARRPPSRRSTRRRASSPRGGRRASRTKTRPESYGTLSHLCASVDHESAAAWPRIRSAQRRDGGRPDPERAVDVDPARRARGRSGRARRTGRTRRCSRCRPGRRR